MATWRDGLTHARPAAAGYGVRFVKSGIAQLAAPVAAHKPEIDRGAMSVTAVLTTRTPDRQGDVIDPAGGEFDEHRTNPVVMFHHGRDHKLPIGKAEDRDGNYTVRLAKGRDGSDALLGTTHFAQKDRFANDVFGLIDEDILRGVSIGFDPLSDPDAVDELGPSPVLKRPALHFKGWKLLEYSHTPLGVNRDALTVAVEKALDGSRPLHPKLLAYLRPAAQPRKTVVAATIPAVRKAMPMPSDDVMPPDDDDAGMGDDGDADGTQDAGFNPAEDDPSADPALADAGGAYASQYDDGSDAQSPTVQAMLDGSQGLLDLCAAIERAMKQSEHMNGRKYAAKLCASLRSDAAKAKAFAEKVKAELAGPMTDDGGDMDGDEGANPGMSSDDDGDEDEAPPVQTDDDGAIVSKGYTPRRWTHADLRRSGAAAPAATTAGSSAAEKSLRTENAQLKRTLENLLNDIEAGKNRR